MKYAVEITSSAQRQFKKLPESIQESLTPKILSLEENPRPVGTKKLQASDYYRIRVGNYRVIYSINDKACLVKILDLGHRKDIYR
ncbi:MAG: type II toxin-antitoxin system RelE/ParE family toxin [Candidatus Omnitrophica bacterium]|nr:type II toxin-antitoxin system RelE/ParE family toxin [Candidatus Omnitrophota bacterium]MDE2027834.1 type II toxin-antitoxin system RelE/ParE family toxin [Candidatus Omnitrophota bacterium]MDE2215504.1 type II toxin-antitoxin system RelE/ParE family toxin [Candidatus Omnitrophota bacterium]